MLVKTEAIVLNKINYSETSIIVKVLTRSHGLQTFLVKGVYRKKSTQKASLFQPLSILEVVFYQKENKEIKIPKEIRLAYAFQSIQSNFLKTSIIIFLAEVLAKAIRETVPDERKYEFIKNSLLHFDLQEEGFVNFHLSFLIKLSNYLGFSITTEELEKHSSNRDFPITSFRSENVSSHTEKKSSNNNLLSRLKQNYSSLSQIQISNSERRELLESIINSYRLHIEKFGEVKSLEVFHQIFD
jgi:DNA repair protein RecO (recombination protein O)